MSETMKINNYRAQLRYQLLVTVSSAALMASVAVPSRAEVADEGHPTVWIEVGGAFDQLDTGDSRWIPPNLTPTITNPPPSPFGKLPATGYDTDLKVSITPDDSDWIFSAAIRYGRAARGPKHSHDQTYKFNIQTQSSAPIKYNLTNWNFANSAQKGRSTHTILDFQIGKDVGLGMFGGKSTFSIGIRVAKLNENADGHLTAIVSAPAKYSPGEAVHIANFAVTHSFSGIGPSVSWDASAPIGGSASDGFSFDWGANAAILVGRQKAHVALHTKVARYYPGAGYPLYTSGTSRVLSQSTAAPARSRVVAVPNVGGFAGVSWRLPSAKISLGYRADFFFGAMDGGLESHKSYDRGFYGPFATISVGLGG